jgi:hypothetical protein
VKTFESDLLLKMNGQLTIVIVVNAFNQGLCGAAQALQRHGRPRLAAGRHSGELD